MEKEKVTEKEKILMIAAAGKAMTYFDSNPNAEIGDIITYVLEEVPARKEEEKLKIIAAANRAINYKNDRFKKTDKEIIRKMMGELDEILGMMQEESN
jgi:hypothetical protein